MGRLGPGLYFALDCAAAGGLFIEVVPKRALNLSDEFVLRHLGILGFDLVIHRFDGSPVKPAAATDFMDAAPKPFHVGTQQSHGDPWLIAGLARKADKGRS